MVQVGVDFLEEMAAAVAGSAFSGVVPQTAVTECIPLVLPEPYGVVLGICPWNAPLALGFRAVGTPLAAGNTVIMKVMEVIQTLSKVLTGPRARSFVPRLIILSSKSSTMLGFREDH
jgi:benzaldehyde dehydrogenase (NAD)